MNKIIGYLKENKRRIVMSFVGVIIVGMSVGFIKTGAMGVDPFTSLVTGLDALIPLDYGIVYIIINVAMLTFSLLTDKHYIGLATFINLFFLGYITQFTLGILGMFIQEPSLVVRVICLVFGIFILCLGCSMYITADLGVSTYDAISIVMANKWKLGKFKYMRICTDVACVICGCILYVIAGNTIGSLTAMVGIGTIITAFFMGPLIEFFNDNVSSKMLGEKKA